jgi:excisionase family DNA binding protein
MDSKERLLLRPAEAAELLSISRTRVYELLAGGELPSVRLGRAVRVPATELRRWVEERSARGTVAATT